ncbi:MAG: serine hydrolase [Dehalococcoidales bacterium]|nr:serine hydrolase [Dehalococcoidales bacterium]
MDSNRLKAIGTKMQTYIDREMAYNFVMAIARKGMLVYHEALGFLDFESRRPAGLDTIFRLYSNSKAIAGTATMILCEEGLLNLDDPISRFIPEFRKPVVVTPSAALQRQTGLPGLPPLLPATREITVRDCLRNTTGLATPGTTTVAVANQYRKAIEKSGWDLAANLDIPPEKSYLERVKNHAKIPLANEPGTAFEYHAGYPVIGVVMELVTGKTLEEFYQEKIFKPLGMNDTSFYLDKEDLHRFPDCYCPSQKGGTWHLVIYDKAETSEKVTGERKWFGPGGDMCGVLSTAGDYTRFAQMLLNGGELDGVRILSRKSVEIMTSSHIGDIRTTMLSPGFGFGMGVGVYTGNSPEPILRSKGTFGWGGAAGTIFFVDPVEELVAVCFTQVFNRTMMPGNDFQEEFERVVYQTLK